MFEKKKGEEVERFLNQNLGELNQFMFNRDLDDNETLSMDDDIFQTICEKNYTYKLDDLFIKKNPKQKILIVVSNELGCGIVPSNQLAREFRDVHGRCNRKIATLSDYVFMSVAGIAVRIK